LTDGQAPASTQSSEIPAPVEDKGLAKAEAAQTPVPPATASPSSGSESTQTPIPPQAVSEPAQEASQAVRSNPPTDPSSGRPTQTEDRQVERTQCATC